MTTMKRSTASLAHELGHLVLHQYLIRESLQQISELESRLDDHLKWWSSFLTPQDEEDLCWQADKFAGFILLPNPGFRENTRHLVEPLIDVLQTGKASQMSGLKKELSSLQLRYSVSPDTFKIRFKDEFKHEHPGVKDF